MLLPSKINDFDERDGFTAYFFAAINGHIEILKLLVDKSVNIEAKFM